MQPLASSWFCISCSTSSSLSFSPVIRKEDSRQTVRSAVNWQLHTVRLPWDRWLTQCCQDVPELGTHDRAVPLLVKNPQALHKVLKRAAVLCPANVLMYGQKLLKVQHLGLHVCRKIERAMALNQIQHDPSVRVLLWMDSCSSNQSTCQLYTQPTFSLWLSKNVHNLCLGRILAQSPDQVSTLSISDFHLVGRRSIEQLESIFEVWDKGKIIPPD